MTDMNDDSVKKFYEKTSLSNQQDSCFFVFCIAIEYLVLLNTLKVMFYDCGIVRQDDDSIINDLNMETKILFSRLIYIIKDKAKNELKLSESSFNDNKTKYQQVWNMSEFFGHLNFNNDYLVFSVSLDDMFNCLFDILKIINPEVYSKINIKSINDLGLINDNKINELKQIVMVLKK